MHPSADAPILADFLVDVGRDGRVAVDIGADRATDGLGKVADPRIVIRIIPALVRTAGNRGAREAVRKIRAVEVVVLRHVRVGDRILVQILVRAGRAGSDRSAIDERAIGRIAALIGAGIEPRRDEVARRQGARTVALDVTELDIALQDGAGGTLLQEARLIAKRTRDAAVVSKAGFCLKFSAS